MARTRTIKPSFFTNEELAKLSPLTRLLFIGLWTQADREGRLEDRPRRLKAAILPFDRYPIEHGLQALVDGQFIVRYRTVDGLSIIQVRKFADHQSPHPKEESSVLPKYDESMTDRGADSKKTEVMHESSMTHASAMHKPSKRHASIMHESCMDSKSVNPAPLALTLTIDSSESNPPGPPSDASALDAVFGPSSAPSGAPTKTAGTDAGSADKAKPAKRTKARTPAPEITPTAEMYAWAAELGLDEKTVNRETLKMLDHHRAVGSLMADWVAAWRKWMRNVPEFQRSRASGRLSKPPTPIRPIMQHAPSVESETQRKRREEREAQDAARQARADELEAQGMDWKDATMQAIAEERARRRAAS